MITPLMPSGGASLIDYPHKRRSLTPQRPRPPSDKSHQHEVTPPTATPTGSESLTGLRRRTTAGYFVRVRRRNSLRHVSKHALLGARPRRDLADQPTAITSG